MCDCPEHKLEIANAIAQGKEAGRRERSDEIARQLLKEAHRLRAKVKAVEGEVSMEWIIGAQVREDLAADIRDNPL